MNGRRRFWRLGLLLAGGLLLANCAAPAPLPLVATEAPAGSALLPTAALSQGDAAAATPTPPVGGESGAPVSAPTPTLALALQNDSFQVALPTISPDNPLRFSFPTPVIFNTPENWRPPLVSPPLSLRPEDHFWFTRPIASDSVNYPLGSYRYGSSYFGQMHVHAGIDIDAPRGTPILATGPGQVIWAGWGLFNFDPRRTDDPYGIAVAIRHDFGFQGSNLYTLYAHMEAQNNLYVGQRVKTGDLLGWVGVTGNTTGPHVHYEVREGRNDYFSTRNPELWIAPYSGWGVLVGQLLDKSGRYMYDTPIDIFDAKGGLIYTVYTYGDRVAHPDDAWRENFAISDLPAGTYRLKARIGETAPPLPPVSATPVIANPQLEGVAAAPQRVVVPPPLPPPSDQKPLEAWVTVIAGQTNFILLQAEVGALPNARPAETATPPYPADTATPTLTPTASDTPTETRTPRPTLTLTPSRTPRPTLTPTPTLTPRFSATPSPTVTPTATP